MKTLFLKLAFMAIAILCFNTGVYAQGFLNKLKDAAKKVESVTGVATNSTDNKEASTDTTSVSSKEFLENVPNYSVKKVIETDSLGNQLKNEDGTVKYSFLLIDKDGKVCEKNAAKKHLNNALKSGGAILAKVGVGAGVGAMGALLGGGSKKEALIGAGVGAAAGLLASADDIKEVRKQVKLMKECKKVLEAYEKTFTDEGTPIDASVDLTNVDGINFAECEEITKSSEDIKKEFMASKTEGESLDDLDLPESLS